LHHSRSAVTGAFLAAALLVAGCAGATVASQAQAEPAGAGSRAAALQQRGSVGGGEPTNVVLITTDDMTASELRWMPKTRRLLGREGVTFTDSISPHPLCCPARAEILTGQFAQNNGVRTNNAPYGGYYRLDSSDTLPVWLRRAGYQTTFMGKYLNEYGTHSAHEVPPGWDSWRATVGNPYDYNNYVVNADGDLRLHTGHYQTDYYADLTERAVSRLSASGQPFFLWQSHIAPHLSRPLWPVLTGEQGWEAPTPSGRYHGPLERLPQPDTPAYNEADVSDKPRYIRRTPTLDQGTREWLSELHQRRIETLRSVDDAVARTVGVLTQTGELDNTLLIFTSDNGYLLGQHRHEGKNVPYEAALQVPLLMRGPSVPDGVRSPATTTTVDLAPTVLAAAGAKPGLPIDGRNLLPVARGDQPGWDTTLIQGGPRTPEEGPGWFFRGVRTDRYTYVEYRQTGEVELYDRWLDPYQLHNVAGQATYAGVQAELHHRLLQLQDCSGSDCRRSFGPVPNGPRVVSRRPGPPAGPLLSELSGRSS
jgi:N-acetylglucosamine-6-sulfatase